MSATAFHCHALDLRFEADECAARQGARYESGAAVFTCGGGCVQGRVVLGILGHSAPIVMIPADHCPEHPPGRSQCEACVRARRSHAHALLALAGRPNPGALRTAQTPPAAPAIEEEPMAQKCNGCGGSRHILDGKPDDGLCGGCRRGVPAVSTGDKEQARAYIAAQRGEQPKPAAAEPRRAKPPPSPPPPPKRAPSAPHLGLPDVRLLSSEYLVACAAEARRRVEDAGQLASAFDNATGNKRR